MKDTPNGTWHVQAPLPIASRGDSIAIPDGVSVKFVGKSARKARTL